jgi:ribosomal protein L44E
MIKAIILDLLLAEWFTKSLLPPITCDVSMGGAVTKEETIAHAQYLDLVYSQSGTLYEFLLNAARDNVDPSKTSSSSHADSFISFVKTQSTSQSTTLSSTSPQNQISKVNEFQSSLSQQSEGKKKAKNKPKNTNNNEQPKNQAQTPATKKQPQWKLKFTCIICGDDHYTRDFPHFDEVAKLFQGNSQPIVLTHPFPQQQSMVSQTPSPRGSSSHPHDEA